MKILKACLDQELLWVVDDVICGLYSINTKTFEIECVIDYRKLFIYGKFRIQSLIKWNDDYILIIPLDIDKKWILYNKITKEIEYRKIVEQKYQERLIAIDKDRDKLYFFPLRMSDPAFIVDLKTLTYYGILENWGGKVLCDCHDLAWTGTYNGKYVFYPQKNSKIIVRIDCETQKVDMLELDISEGLIDINYAFEELWVLPIKGNKFYQIDENGRIINTGELTIEATVGSVVNFARIVVQKRYLFLLPTYRRGIYVYDKKEGKTHIVPEESSVIKNKENYLRYWEYCIKDNQICFLPFQDKYIEINLDTFTYSQKKLLYPQNWSEEELVINCVESHVSELNFIIEKEDECNLKIYLKYIQYKIDAENFLKNKNIGHKVWNKLMLAPF